MLVILRMCGEVKVKVAHLELFSVLVGGVARVILCCIWCLSCLVYRLRSCFFSLYRSFPSKVSQLKICDSSGERFKDLKCY